MAQSVELVCAKEDIETAGIRDEIREKLEDKGLYTITYPTDNIGYAKMEERSSRDTPFAIFLWTDSAAKDTHFQLLSLRAERKQVEDRVVRCINVLLEEDVNIAHIKQDDYKLKWSITGTDEEKQEKISKLVDKLHAAMQDSKDRLHQRIGNVSEGLVWNYVVVYLKTILDKETGYWSMLKHKKTLSTNEIMDQKAREYFLIIPDTGYCPEKFEEYLSSEFIYMSFDGEDDELEINVDDAGMQDRPFIATIRRLHDDENDQDYYFIGEFANPVNTLYQMCEEGIIRPERRSGFVDRFKTRLRYILDHEHIGLAGTYKIIELPDVGVDNGHKIPPEEAGAKLKELLLQELRELCKKTKE